MAMVAIFTGSGTGLENGSGAVLGGAGLLGQASLGRAGEKLFFNAANGNLVINQQDEFLVAKGPDIGISRTYNSQGTWDGDNGDNWQLGTTRRIYDLTGTQDTAGSTIKRQSADGSVTTFTWDAGRNAYVTTDGSGAYDEIQKIGNYWVWTDGSKDLIESYGAFGTNSWRIVEQKDGDNNKITFTYSGANLSRIDITDPGDDSYIEYSWTGNNITKVTTGYTDLATGNTNQTLTRTHYGYDSSNRLTSVTTDLSPHNNSTSDGNTYVTTYTYDGTSNRVASISQTDGSSIAMLYDSSGRVTQFTQTVAVGETRITGIVYNTEHTVITDPTGQQIKLYFDAKDRLITIVSPPPYTGAAEQKTRFTYNTNGDVLTVRAADDAGITSYEYDDNGNVTKITDPNGNVTVRTYDANNNLLRESEFFSDLLSHGTDLLTQGTAGSPSSMSNLYTEWSLVNGVATQSASGNVWAAIAARDVVAVQPGQQYTVSAEIKIENATYDSAGGPPIGLGFIVLDGNHGQISHNANWPTGAAATELLDNGWVRVDYTYTAGANDHFLRPHFYRRPSLSGAGDISVRNFGLIQSNGGQTEVVNTRYVYDSENHLRYVVSAQGHVTEYRYLADGQLQFTIEYPEHEYPVGATALTEAILNSWRDTLGNKPDIKILQHAYDARGNLASTIDYGAATSAGAVSAVIIKFGDLVGRIGHAGDIDTVTNSRRPGFAGGDGLFELDDPARGIVEHRNAGPVGLGYGRDPVGCAIISIAGDIGDAVTDRIVLRGQISGDSDQPVTAIIAIIGPGQGLGGAGCEIRIAGGDLGDVVAGPAILRVGTVLRGYLVELVVDIAIGQLVAVGVAMLGNPPAVSDAMSAIQLGLLCISIGPGPRIGAVNELVVRSATALGNIGRLACIPGIQIDCAVLPRMTDIGSSCIEGTFNLIDSLIGALAPVVAIFVGEIALAVVRPRDPDIRTRADKKLVLLVDHQIAVGRIKEQLFARPAQRGLSQQPGAAQ
ncbi:MAG: hypothetical protein AAGE37_01135 [Pseudomonadota bacterium]